jgi:hypothetical protein
MLSVWKWFSKKKSAGGNPLVIIKHAETEIQRLIAKRTLMKSQLRDMPDLIDAQFEIINKAKALLNEVNEGETK